MYPKIIINEFIGVEEDIKKLESETTIYRGTSKDEFESKNFGQSLKNYVLEKLNKSSYIPRYGTAISLKLKVLIQQIMNDIDFY